jgi:hypothetical protein
MFTKKASATTTCCYSSTCAFFNSPDLSAPELLLRKIYCLHAGCQNCAIYLRLAAGKPVPPGICPDGEIKISDRDKLS